MGVGGVDTQVMGVIMARTLIISTGGNRKALKWKQVTCSIDELYERLKTPSRGVETIAEYFSMKKSQQDDLKDVGGFMAGTLIDGRRKAANVTGRSIVTLDFDNIPDGQTDAILQRVESMSCNYCVYSTRKHRPTAPRLRVLFPSDRDMTPDEYEPCARRMAEYIGIGMADPTTFEVSRLMYWPSCCADGEYVYRADAQKPCFSVDSLLATYKDWHDIAEWPQVPGSFSYQKLAIKQGDPESKPGIVGAFCRIYDIYRAIDELLPGIYEPTDTDKDRYTYTGGSTTGGAIVYDDGKFLFSHHATDPCSGRLVNSFDLVRLHMFGDADDASDASTPVNRLPSYKQMTAFANGLDDVAVAIAKEQYDSAIADFTGVGANNDDDPGNWMLMLDRNGNGVPIASIKNYAVILENDPRLKGRIKNDSFADRTYGIAPLPWGGRGSMRESADFSWTDADDSGMRGYFEKLIPAGNKGKLEDALADHLAKHSFNPVQDYLNNLTWDGTPRLDSLFIDYLGAEDSEYNRAVTRKTFAAAVSRAMNPGCKYDQMTVLCGPQGIGKSTIIDKMSRGYYNDSIRTFEGKEASELLQGVWLVEVAELDQFWNANQARIKQFLTVREDRYRAAYGHRAAGHPRTCIFFGTCNSTEFLRDITGNRRFWPVDVGVISSSKSVFDDLSDCVIDQVWAEAKMRWQMGEPLYLTGDVAKHALEQQESHMESNPLEDAIAEWIEKPIPDDWRKWTIERRQCFWNGLAEGGSYTLVARDRVCAKEIMREMLGWTESDTLDRRRTAEINAILSKLGWKRRKQATPLKYPPYGGQRILYERPLLPQSGM